MPAAVVLIGSIVVVGFCYWIRIIHFICARGDDFVVVLLLRNFILRIERWLLNCPQTIARDLTTTIAQGAVVLFSRLYTRNIFCSN